MSRSREFDHILKTLLSVSTDIEAIALVSEDGVMLASALPQHFEEARVAALGSTLLNLGARAIQELRRGALEQILISGRDGHVAMNAVGDGTLLMVVTTSHAKLGLVYMDMAKAAEEIRNVPH